MYNKNITTQLIKNVEIFLSVKTNAKTKDINLFASFIQKINYRTTRVLNF